MPGFANRRVAGRVYRALVGFQRLLRWFPPGLDRSHRLAGARGVFRVAAASSGGSFTMLITGGSQGPRTLNRASAKAGALFSECSAPVTIHPSDRGGRARALATEFAGTGIAGEVVPFITDMAAAFASADLVVGRAGAGAVSEIAAAGMPSLLVPLPFAADDHQRKNAEALVIEAGGAHGS